MNLTTVKGFFRKEFAQVLRDPRMRIVLFIVPMIQMMLFGYAISTEVRNVRLLIQGAPDDTLLTRIAEKSFSSGWFVPARPGLPGLNDPFQAVRSGSADAALIVPPGGATRALERGEGKLQVLIDASNVIRAQSVERYLQAIVNQVLEETRLTSHEALPAFSLSVRVVYNPSLESSIFMVPGVMGMILGIVAILLTSMSIAREKEMGTFEMIISAPVKTWEVILGKTLPFVLLGMLNAATVLLIARLAFNIPMRGAVIELGAATVTFVTTCVSIGTLISTFSKTQQQAMMAGFIFLFLSNLLSGIMFPIDNMPLPLKAVAYLNPLTYYVALLRNIMLKSGAPEIVWTYIGILASMGTLAIWASFKRFRHTLE